MASPKTVARWRQRFPEFDAALNTGIDAQLRVAEPALFNVANGYLNFQERFISTKAGMTKVVEQKISHTNPAMFRLFLEANKPEKYPVNAKQDNGEASLAEFLREIQERETNNYAKTL